MKNKNFRNSRHVEGLKNRRRKAFTKKLILYVFVFVIFFVGLGYLSQWQKMNIQDFEIFGNSVVEAEEVKTLVKEELSGKYIWLFPKTNFLLYPKDKIKEELAHKFTILNNIDLNLAGTKTLKITISERRAKYMWCGATPIEENTDCYFMDDVGFIYVKAPYFSGNVYFKFFGHVGEEESVSPLGNNFYSENFQKLIFFKDSLQSIGLEPASLVIKKDGEAEFFLSPSSNNLKIIFRLGADYEKLLENLETALQSEPLKTHHKNKFENLSYIDLRFGNKLYFK